MSAGVEHICRSMVEYLKRHGVEAAAAWPGTPRQEGREPVVAVSLRGCRAHPSGFQDYLGERYDKDSGLWQERYGRRAELTFGLDIYGPEKGDGGAVQRTFDALAGALLCGGPEGMQVEEFSCGETAYDQSSRRLKRPAQAVCAAYLTAQPQSGGLFVDFELRGVAEV